MTTGGHIYWLSNRTANQFATVATVVPNISKPAGSTTLVTVVRRSALIPSGVIFGMILLAAVGICSTVIYRSRAELAASASQYQRLSSEVDIIRRSNALLTVEITRMTRLGMVRKNDIVVPIGSLESSSNSALVSLVH